MSFFVLSSLFHFFSETGGGDTTAAFATRAVFVFLVNFGVLIFIFAPKIMEHYKPTQESVLGGHSSASSGSLCSNSGGESSGKSSGKKSSAYVVGSSVSTNPGFPLAKPINMSSIVEEGYVEGSGARASGKTHVNNF